MKNITSERYREERFTHNSPEELFKELNLTPRHLSQRHISRAYVKNDDDNEKIRLTELELAAEAIAKGYECVTNIDYCGPCIAATGWTYNK